MNSPTHPLRLLSLLAASGLAAATAAYCLTPGNARAASANGTAGGTGGSVHVVLSVKQNSGPIPDTTTSSGPALPTGKGAGGSTLVASALKTQAWLEITVKNVGDSDVNGLTINYHVFSRTSVEGKTASVTMKDASGTQTVSIPYGKSVVVKTPPIIKQLSSGLPASGGNRGNGNAASSFAARPTTGKTAAVTTSTVTDIAGSYVEAITDNPNKPVATAENPGGIVQQFQSLAPSAN